MSSSTSSPPASSTEIVDLDVAVIGGGIAGLWLMNKLEHSGYSAALFEKNALGSDQTLASQGMIHGGIKYTLAGSLSKASETIADMPGYWSRCLRGEGDVDLRGAKLLSKHFFFWSSEGAASRMSTFFASKAVQGRVTKISRDDYPALLQNPQFSGQVYQLQDIVLDVPSVLATLADNIKQPVVSLAGSNLQWRREGKRVELLIETGGNSLCVRAKQFVLTAGKGNADILSALGEEKPRMQLRPVHQVWVKHASNYDFYGHCLGADTTPRISISTHPTRDGNKVWSLGGSIAEVGVKQSEAEVIAAAQRELRELLPWVSLDGAEWMAQRIDRAEARQRNFLRPDKAYAKSAERLSNVVVGWPTKLTLAPNLANEVMQVLDQAALRPSAGTNIDVLSSLPEAEVGLPPWERALPASKAQENS